MDYFDSSPSHKSQTGKELLYKDFFDPPDPEEVKVHTEVKAQAADKGRKLVRFEKDDSDIGSEGDEGDDDESASGEELDWGGMESEEEGEGGRWVEEDTSGEEEELENLSRHEKKELMVSGENRSVGTHEKRNELGWVGEFGMGKKLIRT